MSKFYVGQQVVTVAANPTLGLAKGETGRIIDIQQLEPYAIGYTVAFKGKLLLVCESTLEGKP